MILSVINMETEPVRDIKNVKLNRRNVKGKFTRCAKILLRAIDETRPKCVITEAFQAVAGEFEKLQSIHEVLVGLIEDDDAFQHEEDWITDVENDFISIKIRKEGFEKQVSTESNFNNNAVSRGNSSESDELPTQSVSAHVEYNSSDVSSQRHNNTRSVFKVEKPKLPKFIGDIRDYLMFKADFKEFVEINILNGKL